MTWGLEPCHPRPYRHSLTEQDGAAPPVPDLVNRDFTAERPGQKMVRDITYWNGWATYVGLNDFGGDTAEPLYPCLYCTPDAAAANCSTIQNSGAFPSVGVWSSEWQECGTSLAHPPSWNAQSCSAELTVLWQFCDGTGICNGSYVDQDLNYTGFSLADCSFYLISHP